MKMLRSINIMMLIVGIIAIFTYATLEKNEKKSSSIDNFNNESGWYQNAFKLDLSATIDGLKNVERPKYDENWDVESIWNKDKSSYSWSNSKSSWKQSTFGSDLSTVIKDIISLDSIEW